MKWVRIVDNKVYEIIPEESTTPSIATWYGEEFANLCVEAPDEVMQNWHYEASTGAFMEEDPSPPGLPESGATVEDILDILEKMLGVETQ